MCPPPPFRVSIKIHLNLFLIQSRECQAVFTGHTNKINCLLVSSILNMLPGLFTGSSDETIRCYSIKVRYVMHKQQLCPPHTHTHKFLYMGALAECKTVLMLHFIMSHADPDLPGGVLFIRQGFMFAQCLECAFCWTCQRLSGQL